MKLKLFEDKLIYGDIAIILIGIITLFGIIIVMYL